MTRLIGFCVYCGRPVRTRVKDKPTVCRAHSDLPKRDPHYAQPVDQWAEVR